MASKGRFRNCVAYLMGEDFTKEEYDKWLSQVALWISETQTSEDNPRKKAEKILDAAIKGTKLNGEVWPGVDSFTLDSRIRQFCGWDIIKETGRRSVTKASNQPSDSRKNRNARKRRRKGDDYLEQASIAELVADREAHKELLYNEFPFLDNPVYEANVNALADATIKLKRISEEFLGASGSELKNLLDLRDSLKSDIDDFMKLLRIHPTQVKDKSDEGDRGDIGTLINKWEEYGEISDLYQKVDAIQEAIQIINQLENVRVDGSPQLADWLLWHKTACRGHKFTCECGKEYDIHGGFTKEEMYKIAEQSRKTFGFGLEEKKLKEFSNTE